MCVCVGRELVLSADKRWHGGLSGVVDESPTPQWMVLTNRVDECLFFPPFNICVNELTYAWRRNGLLLFVCRIAML